MNGILLYIVSFFLKVIAYPFAITFKFCNKLKHYSLVFKWQQIDNYFLLKAIENDKFCNGADAELLTALFITKRSIHPFGNKAETISSVLGKNYLAGTLTKRGYELCALLNELQPNHVFLSIDNNV